jgi:hypothetical protein
MREVFDAVNRSSQIRLGLFILAISVALYRGLFHRGIEQSAMSLSEARKGFTTHVLPSAGQRDPVDSPPADKLKIVKYTASNGPLPAYVSPDPRDGQKHPAIVWITGGDCN